MFIVAYLAILGLLVFHYKCQHFTNGFRKHGFGTISKEVASLNKLCNFAPITQLVQLKNQQKQVYRIIKMLIMRALIKSVWVQSVEVVCQLPGDISYGQFHGLLNLRHNWLIITIVIHYFLWFLKLREQQVFLNHFDFSAFLFWSGFWPHHKIQDCTGAAKSTFPVRTFIWSMLNFVEL